MLFPINTLQMLLRTSLMFTKSKLQKKVRMRDEKYKRKSSRKTYRKKKVYQE